MKTQIEDIIIKKIIVHILDTTMTIPVLSQDEMPTSIDVNEFFASHITKVLNNDNVKKCKFDEDYNMFLNYLKTYKNSEVNFVQFSKEIAAQLFAIMNANINIPGGDLVVVKYRLKQIDYLAILKLNYQNAFIHYTDYEAEVNVNTIIQHRTTLPSMSQRVSEGAIINLDTLDVHVLDKRYEIDGEKKNYLSKLFFKCYTELSSKEKFNALKVATNRVTKKFFDENEDKKAEIDKILYNNLDEEGELNIEQFTKEAFPAMEEVKEIFFDTLEKKGVNDPVIKLEEKTIENGFNFKKIKTDNGIEIKIPMEMYNNPSKMEFEVQEDGKIHVVLKDIKKIL